MTNWKLNPDKQFCVEIHLTVKRMETFTGKQDPVTSVTEERVNIDTSHSVTRFPTVAYVYYRSIVGYMWYIYDFCNLHKTQLHKYSFKTMRSLCLCFFYLVLLLWCITENRVKAIPRLAKRIAPMYETRFYRIRIRCV